MLAGLLGGTTTFTRASTRMGNMTGSMPTMATTGDMALLTASTTTGMTTAAAMEPVDTKMAERGMGEQRRARLQPQAGLAGGGPLHPHLQGGRAGLQLPLLLITMAMTITARLRPMCCTADPGLALQQLGQRALQGRLARPRLSSTSGRAAASSLPCLQTKQAAAAAVPLGAGGQLHLPALQVEEARRASAELVEAGRLAGEALLLGQPSALQWFAARTAIATGSLAWTCRCTRLATGQAKQRGIHGGRAGAAAALALPAAVVRSLLLHPVLTAAAPPSWRVAPPSAAARKGA